MSMPLSNPMANMTAAQQQRAWLELKAERQRAVRQLVSLLTIVLGIALLATAGGLAFGLVGVLAGLGLPLFVLGLMLGLLTPASGS